jgi:hypothetical protein
MNKLTCVFCGKEYPLGTPASQHKALYKHIAQCPKHPLSKAVTLLKRVKTDYYNPSELVPYTFIQEIEDLFSTLGLTLK